MKGEAGRKDAAKKHACADISTREAAASASEQCTNPGERDSGDREAEREKREREIKPDRVLDLDVHRAPDGADEDKRGKWRCSGKRRSLHAEERRRPR